MTIVHQFQNTKIDIILLPVKYKKKQNKRDDYAS